MTLGSVNVNFKVVLPQGQTKDEVETHLLSLLAAVLDPVPTVVEFELIPGTKTKVDPFDQAEVRQFVPQMVSNQRQGLQGQRNLPGSGDY